ncbi:MAG TPA: hypothetical protein VH300_02425 [Thermoleophilaceae bacterium]|nr:hypothetical protein [Thermoleophilaceae bacterium]
MTWAFLWLMVGLKIPIIALCWIVWRAIKAEPVPPEDAALDVDDGGGPKHPKPRRPRSPRRGPHGEPLPQPPARVRAVADPAPRVR